MYLTIQKPKALKDKNKENENQTWNVREERASHTKFTIA